MRTPLIFFFLLLTINGYAQNAPAADRAVVPLLSDSSIEVDERLETEESFSHLKTKSVSAPRRKKHSNSLRSSKRELHKKHQEKVKRRPTEFEFLWGTIGVIIMLASLVTGIILFASIAWWAVLIAAVGIVIGLLVCAIPGMYGSGRLAGIGAGIMGAIGLVVSLIGMAVWGIVGLIVWLVKM